MKRKPFLIILIVVAAVALLAGCSLFGGNTFSGSRVRNPDRYYLDFQIMTQKDSATLVVPEGSSLHCTWNVRKGTVDILVEREGGEVIYRGNKVDEADFLLIGLAEGHYVVTVDAKRAKGVIDITLQ